MPIDEQVQSELFDHRQRIHEFYTMSSHPTYLASVMGGYSESIDDEMFESAIFGHSCQSTSPILNDLIELGCITNVQLEFALLQFHDRELPKEDSLLQNYRVLRDALIRLNRLLSEN